MLVAQEPALTLDAAAVAGEQTIGANHAVARYDDSDRIRAVGKADRADSVRPADSGGQRGVGGRRATGDFPQGMPYIPLKRGACRLHW